MIDALAHAFGEMIADIRNKLVAESFWGRHTPEAPRHGGWADVSADAGHAPDDRSLLDRLYGNDPETVSPDPGERDHGQDRGIDR